MHRFLLRASAALLSVSFHSVVAADTRVDVSRIIDKTEAASILDEPVRDLSPRNGDGGDGYYSKSNYYSVNRGKSLVIRLHVAAPNANWPAKRASTDCGEQRPDANDRRPRR